jgi:hypothetical protein
VGRGGTGTGGTNRGQSAGDFGTSGTGGTSWDKEPIGTGNQSTRDFEIFIIIISSLTSIIYSGDYVGTSNNGSSCCSDHTVLTLPTSRKSQFYVDHMGRGLVNFCEAREPFNISVRRREPFNILVRRRNQFSLLSFNLYLFGKGTI